MLWNWAVEARVMVMARVVKRFVEEERENMVGGLDEGS